MAVSSTEFQERMKKLQEIREQSINPFPERFERSHMCSEARILADEINLRDSTEIISDGPTDSVRLCGRIKTFRMHGKLSFAHIQDQSGQMQICFAENTLGKERYKWLKYFDMGDFIGVWGELFKTHKGENTLYVKEYVMLSKALRSLPEKWHGLQDQELKYRQRYLDLTVDRETQERFMLRSRLIELIRQFLLKADFLEVETPILATQASGAAAKPFKTYHKALDFEVFLRIAPETYLKRCVSGGFERVFEFAKCFRNEGMDPSHLQEFTMLEYYAAYWNFQDNMKFTEQLFSEVLMQLIGTLKLNCLNRNNEDVEIDFTPPWPRKLFRELIMEHCAIDILDFDDAESLRREIAKKGLVIEDMGKMGLGNLYDALYKKVARPNLIQPTFVIKHPVMTKPLARRSDDDPRLCDTFQLLVNTWEIINAYSELIDPVDQRQRLEAQAEAKAAGDEEAMDMDEDYLICMEHAMPPMSGWGMGIDRLVALITRQDNLKDVVLFPLLKAW